MFLIETQFGWRVWLTSLPYHCSTSQSYSVHLFWIGRDIENNIIQIHLFLSPSVLVSLTLSWSLSLFHFSPSVIHSWCPVVTIDQLVTGNSSILSESDHLSRAWFHFYNFNLSQIYTARILFPFGLTIGTPKCQCPRMQKPMLPMLKQN